MEAQLRKAIYVGISEQVKREISQAKPEDIEDILASIETRVNNKIAELKAQAEKTETFTITLNDGTVKTTQKAEPVKMYAVELDGKKVLVPTEQVSKKVVMLVKFNNETFTLESHTVKNTGTKRTAEEMMRSLDIRPGDKVEVRGHQGTVINARKIKDDLTGKILPVSLFVALYTNSDPAKTAGWANKALRKVSPQES